MYWKIYFSLHASTILPKFFNRSSIIILYFILFYQSSRRKKTIKNDWFWRCSLYGGLGDVATCHTLFMMAFDWFWKHDWCSIVCGGFEDTKGGTPFVKTWGMWLVEIEKGSESEFYFHIQKLDNWKKKKYTTFYWIWLCLNLWDIWLCDGWRVFLFYLKFDFVLKDTNLVFEKMKYEDLRRKIKNK